jgi:hypothetical protein
MMVMRRVLNLRTSSEADKVAIVLEPPEGLPGRPALEIGPASSQFQALSGARGNRFTIRMKNVRSSQHDDAILELRSYADSLFFQIEALAGSTFVLERGRRGIRPIPRSRRGEQLVFPTAEYSRDAMSLFLYAKSARDMPLLQFLAYYQAVEFFFPRYSQVETRKRVSSILKNPTFRPHRDDDVDRLISALHGVRGSSLGSEKAQLRAVINECISAADVRAFLSADTERLAYFTGKTPRYHKVPLANKDADLRNDVADRIYGIRCKIVHTKNEDDGEEMRMILPYSDDADLLVHDIDLVDFIAKNVLAASSNELT